MKSRWLTLVILLGLSFMVVTSAQQASPPSQEETTSSNITFTTYGKFEGLLAKDIKGFVQDEAGYLYIATNQGVWKYNGSQFYPVVTTRQGLASNNVLVLFQDSHGAIWAGTSKGLNKIVADEVVATFSLGSPIWTKPVEDSEGDIWYISIDNQTLRQIVNDQIVATYAAEDGFGHGFKLLAGSDGAIWIGTEGGLVEFKQGEILQTITQADGLRNDSVHELFADQQGDIWVSDIDGGLSHIKADGTIEVVEPLAGYLEVALVDHHNAIWLGSAIGLVRYQPGREPEMFTSEQGLADNYILSIFEDRDNNIWIGTINGISKITANRAMRGYKGAKIYSQIADHANQIWLGTATGLYQLLGDNLVRTHTVAEGLGSDNIKALLEDAQQRLWVGSTGGLSMLVDGQVVKTYTAEDGLPSNEVWSLLLDNKNRLWVGTNAGIAILENDIVSQTISGVADETVQTRIEALYEDETGNIYVGANGYGLTMLASDGSFKRNYSEADGFIGSRVRNITADGHGSIWVVASDGATHHMQAGEIVATYKSDDEAILDVPRSVVVGPDGTVWVGLDGFGLSSLVDGEFRKNYSYADGLINSTIYSLSKDKNGTILIGTGSGLVKFDTTPFTLDLRLDGVTAPKVDEAGRAYEVWLTPDDDGSYRIIPDDDNIRFRYASINYEVEGKVFQTKLEGYDEFWQDMGAQTYRAYMNLPAGNYTFRTRIENFDGSLSTEELAVPIKILPPWWESAWFQAFVLAFLALFIFALFRWRIHAIEQQNVQLEEQVTERTKELTEKTEALALSNKALARTNDELEVARKKAEVANEAKSAFLANMSHELRSPLNAILGFAQVIIRSPNLTRENIEHLSIISRSGDHLLTLINQVLDLSKIEAGRTTLNETDFDLYRMLDDIDDMFSLKAENKEVDLKFKRQRDIPRYIRTDEIKLRQVLINLLSNALKFTTNGSVTVQIQGSNGEQPQAYLLHVTVTDTGPGIASDELDKLFEAFVQTSSGQKLQEGTGLGLPISRRFVQLMGGDITVSSTVTGPQTGATFSFTITVQIVDMVPNAPDPDSSLDYRNVIGLEPGQPRYRILIVDDRWTNRHLLFKLLEPLGFEVREASNGQEAINLWEEWSPHLIWMDMRMPVMDGYEATEKIKSQVKGQATAIIALTASVLEEERAIVLSAGCDAMVRKPFREAEIYETMHKHIGVRYLHKTPELMPDIHQTDEDIEANTAAQISQLPAYMRIQLAQAANENDLSGMNDVIQQITSQNPMLAEILLQLADEFEYETIAKLVAKGEAHA